MPKILEHFYWTFYHLRRFKSAGRKNSVQKSSLVQKSNTFLKASKTKFHALLSHFAKCRDLCVKSAPRLPKIEGGWGGGGFSQFGQYPYLDCFI